MADAAALDIEQIRRVIALYCQLCDDGRFDEWTELYADDAQYTVMGETYVGPEAIKAFIERGQPPELRGKHVCSDSLIDLGADGRTASAATDFIFVGRTDEGLAVTSAGRYLDTFVRDGDRWRFQSRAIVFMGE
jgi:3-phenylpropionate/cinnamic acid dioxygenase small subunit